MKITDIEIEMPTWDGESYNWDEDIAMEIQRTMNGEITPGAKNRENALLYVQQRFGVVFSYLPAEFQSDPEIAYVAACQSKGNSLLRCSDDIRNSFGPDFYVAVIQNGVRPWILNYVIREDVKKSAEVLKAVTDLMEKEQEAIAKLLKQKS